jgi:thiol-disulfide isomerase/thioredoxin
MEAEFYAEWLVLADRSPNGRAAELAREVLEWPAPAELKEKARGIVHKQESLGKPYPILLPGIDGRMLDSSKLLGKVILIDFWAMWCAPCREALPKLKSLHATRQTQGFEILGINFDDAPRALRRFTTKEGIGWPQHSVPGGFNSAAARHFGLTRLPSLWLIDKRGRLRALDARENLEAKVDQLLAENPIE